MKLLFHLLRFLYGVKIRYDKDCQFYVIRIPGKGSCDLHIYDKSRSLLVNLYVDPAYRKCGLERILIKMAELLTAVIGRSVLLVLCKFSSGKVPYYKEMGFTISGSISVFTILSKSVIKSQYIL